MPTVLLSTTVRWPSAARIAGALSENGCTVDALFPDDHTLAASRYPARRFAYRALKPLASLADAIRKSKPDLIVACDDRALSHLHALHAASPEFRTSIERSLGDPGCYGELASRSGFVTAARLAGISAPETVSVDDEASFEFALRLIGLPAVLKADGSWGGDGVAIVHDEDAARAAWKRLRSIPSPLRRLAHTVRRRDAHFLRAGAKPAISLQRYIDGAPATSSFFCWKGEVIAANHFDVLITSGESGPASVVTRIDDPIMDEAVHRLAARFGLSGLHGLDFVRDRQGCPHLIEINPRATQTSHLAFGPGHDLGAALAACTGGHGQGRTPIPSRSVALFPQEWRRDRSSAWLHAAHHDVPWDDPRLVDACLATHA